MMGSSEASGTSWRGSTIIMDMSSPSQGISKTWYTPPASCEPSLNSPEREHTRTAALKGEEKRAQMGEDGGFGLSIDEPLT